MSTSKFDAVYRSITISKFFTKGWGKPENLRRLFEFRKIISNRDQCFKLVERDYPVTITKEQKFNDCRLLEGYFFSPLEKHLPGIVPEAAQKAHFQIVLPLQWQDPVCKPVCLHLAGTGDHFFWRRRSLLVKPLLKMAGIGGIILENPFYGLRKPTDQVRSSLQNVSDIFVMGGCLILESLVLFHWCERNGLGPLGVTGLSMGGHMASLAATNWPKPLVLVPCLSWSTASAVFLQGVLSHSINWDLLEDQYLSDGVYREKLSKMVTIVDEAFLAGKKFARTYSKNIEKTDKVIEPLIKTKQEIKHTLEKIGANLDGAKTTVEKCKVDKENHSNSTIVNDSVEQSMKFNNELKQLFSENKISKSLYDKLTSNEKFELDLKDIENINALNEEKIKEILLRFKLGHIKNVPTTKTVSNDKGLGQNITLSKCKDVNYAKCDIKMNSANDNTTIQCSDIKCEKKPWHVSDLKHDIWLSLQKIPFYRAAEKKIDITKIHWRDREALQFMRGIMDECTHLSNFSVPYDTSLIIAVCAKHDAYVPREDVGNLEEIWPGAEVRYVDAGHISAYLLHQSLFRSCIIEAFERSKKKWKDGKHIP